MPRRFTTPDQLNVLLVGGGGREHSLAWKLKRSPRLGALWTTHPRNPGLAELARPIDFPFSTRELYRAEQFCRRNRIGLVVVGPEEPLAEGVADALTSDTTVVMGPTRAASQLECDKAWAKRLMRSALIPTAEARMFKDPEAASSYIRSRDEDESLVLKASGLARGKGVIVSDGREESLAALKRIMLDREFGAAGEEIVIEERLEGPEISVFALTDGRDIVILDACQDHKRLLENDRGPNTGGMGAYCPTPLMNAKLMEEVQRKILVPTLDALRREGIEYRGVLYAGLMITPGGPKVLEFNARFGDPECQALLPRHSGDLLDLLWRTGAGPGALADLEEFDWDASSTCCIVLAAPGYPDNPRAGVPILGLDKAAKSPDVHIFHAGTEKRDDGSLVTAGGRVLNVVGVGPDLARARQRALDACDLIQFEGKQLRRDIGAAVLATPAR